MGLFCVLLNLTSTISRSCNSMSEVLQPSSWKLLACNPLLLKKWVLSLKIVESSWEICWLKWKNWHAVIKLYPVEPFGFIEVQKGEWRRQKLRVLPDAVHCLIVWADQFHVSQSKQSHGSLRLEPGSTGVLCFGPDQTNMLLNWFFQNKIWSTLGSYWE